MSIRVALIDMGVVIAISTMKRRAPGSIAARDVRQDPGA